MVEIDRLGHARNLIEFKHVFEEVRVVPDLLQIAFEMPEIDRVEADERREQPPVRLGRRGAGDEVALLRQQRLEPVERIEQLSEGLLVSPLRRCETAFVDAVVDVIVDVRVDRIDVVAQIGG